MLTHLPLESILNICDNLTTNDKFKLSYTCHALNEIVTQHALFTDFNPLRLWEPQQLIVERFKNTPHYAAQVKKIVLNFRSMPDDAISQFPVVFPNVTEVKELQGWSSGDRRDEYGDAVKQSLLKWRDALTKYDKDESFDLIACLMETNVFSNVTSLGISPELRRIAGRDKYLNVLDCIKNVPSLKISNFKVFGSTLISWKRCMMCALVWRRWNYAKYLLQSLTVKCPHR